MKNYMFQVGRERGRERENKVLAFEPVTSGIKQSVNEELKMICVARLDF